MRKNNIVTYLSKCKIGRSFNNIEFKNSIIKILEALEFEYSQNIHTIKYLTTIRQVLSIFNIKNINLNTTSDYLVFEVLPASYHFGKNIKIKYEQDLTFTKIENLKNKIKNILFEYNNYQKHQAQKKQVIEKSKKIIDSLNAKFQIITFGIEKEKTTVNNIYLRARKKDIVIKINISLVEKQINYFMLIYSERHSELNNNYFEKMEAIKNDYNQIKRIINIDIIPFLKKGFLNE